MSATAETLLMSSTTQTGAHRVTAPVLSEDRRGVPRFSRKMAVTLMAIGDGAPVDCKTVDIGEGGMCVAVPQNSGLSVGQRIDVAVPSTPDPKTGKSAFFTSCYATVVRSSTPINLDGVSHLGLRFDHPFYL